MSNGQVQNLPLACFMRKRRVSAHNLQGYGSAYKLTIRIANESTRQQASLSKYLEAIADAKHEAAVPSEVLDRLHNRRKLRNRAATKIISKSEATGENDCVYGTKIGRLVPDE